MNKAQNRHHIPDADYQHLLHCCKCVRLLTGGKYFEIYLPVMLNPFNYPPSNLRLVEPEN